MGSTNFGNQNIVFRYRNPSTSESFNNLFFNIVSNGVYLGGALAKVDDATVSVQPLSVFISDSTAKVAIKCETSSVVNVTVDSTNNFIIMRLIWSNILANYVDFISVPIGSILSTDVILGKANFTGAVLDTVDILNRTIPRGVADSVDTSQIKDLAVTTNKIANANITDAKLASKTINDNQGITLTDNPTSLTEELNFIFERIKNIMGTAGWKNTVPISLNDIDRRIIAHGNVAGNYVSSAIYYSTPTIDFPGLILDADTIVTSTALPELHTKLASQRVRSTGGVSSFTATVSGSNVTLADTPAGNTLLAALYEDALVHGGGADTISYSNWRTIIVNGTAYTIVSVTPATRIVVVTGTPTIGSQTVSFPAYLLVNDTCRVYKMNGETPLATDGTTLLSGLRRRSYFQGHVASVGAWPVGGAGAGGAFVYPNAGFGAIAAPLVTDGVHNTPRQSYETETRGMAAYWYIWCGLLP